MKNVKYRFKQIDRIGKVFGEKFLEDERYISGNIKDNRYIKLSNTNYNDQVDVYTPYKRKDNTLYFKTNVVREGKLVCIFKDYPCMKFSKIKMYNKRLFNKYRNNILGRNGILTNNTVYYAI